MNRPQPFTQAFKNNDGSNGVLVNWIDPRSPLADLVTDFWTLGPYPETHKNFRAVSPVVIYRTSEMEN